MAQEVGRAVAINTRYPQFESNPSFEVRSKQSFSSRRLQNTFSFKFYRNKLNLNRTFLLGHLTLSGSYSNDLIFSHCHQSKFTRKRDRGMILLPIPESIMQDFQAILAASAWDQRKQWNEMNSRSGNAFYCWLA